MDSVVTLFLAGGSLPLRGYVLAACAVLGDRTYGCAHTPLPPRQTGCSDIFISGHGRRERIWAMWRNRVKVTLQAFGLRREE